MRTWRVYKNLGMWDDVVKGQDTPEDGLLVVALEDVEDLLTQVSRDFAGAHVNAGVVTSYVRRHLREAEAAASERNHERQEASHDDHR